MKHKFLAFFLSFSVFASVMISGCSENSVDENSETVADGITEIQSADLDNSVDSSEIETSDFESLNSYNKAVENLNQLNSYSIEADVFIGISDGTNDVVTLQKSEINQIKSGNGEFECDLSISESIQNSEYKSECFYRDGWFYIENEDGKYKKQTDYDSVLKSAFALISQVPESVIGAEPETFIDEDGKETFAFSFDIDKLKEENPEFLQSVLYYLGSDHIEDFDINKYLFNVVIDENGVVEKCISEINAFTTGYSSDSDNSIVSTDLNFNMRAEVSIDDINDVKLREDVNFSSFVDADVAQ